MANAECCDDGILHSRFVSRSTITKLLLRFYDTTSGNVLVDGEPIDSLNVSWWRQQIGYVAQTPVLFPGTLRYNIACGKPGASEEEIIAAAKAACADEFIRNLPQGYDTFYSGTSVQLSGGQMQRVSALRKCMWWSRVYRD